MFMIAIVRTCILLQLYKTINSCFKCFHAQFTKLAKEEIKTFWPIQKKKKQEIKMNVVKIEYFRISLQR